MISINDIKNDFKEASFDEILNKIKIYENDERKGVQKLVEQYRKKHTDYLEELKRLDELLKFERKHYARGKKLIAGVDEVGRGPLAGPVVTAAVILPENCKIIGIDDSKKLSAKKREELFIEIKAKAISIGVGVMTNTVIDEINILKATYKAMKQAVEGLEQKPDMLLVDAVTIPDLDIEQEGIVKGDAKSVSIAAASIIAKVTRDEMMVNFGEIYPEYDFASNKGYGSAKHIEAIKKIGLCPIHRRSFTHSFV